MVPRSYVPYERSFVLPCQMDARSGRIKRLREAMDSGGVLGSKNKSPHKRTHGIPISLLWNMNPPPHDPHDDRLGPWTIHESPERTSGRCEDKATCENIGPLERGGAEGVTPSGGKGTWGGGLICCYYPPTST